LGCFDYQLSRLSRGRIRTSSSSISPSQPNRLVPSPFRPSARRKFSRLDEPFQFGVSVGVDVLGLSIERIQRFFLLSRRACWIIVCSDSEAIRLCSDLDCNCRGGYSDRVFENLSGRSLPDGRDRRLFGGSRVGERVAFFRLVFLVRGRPDAECQWGATFRSPPADHRPYILIGSPC
jgi:hypothetical protein